MAVRWWAVSVRGPSMAPTLRHGDALVAWRGARVVPGAVVIARFPARPDIGLVVKRAIRPVPGGWWLEGDNDLLTDDSRSYGPALVEARVILRYRPQLRLIRVGRTRLP